MKHTKTMGRYIPPVEDLREIQTLRELAKKGPSEADNSLVIILLVVAIVVCVFIFLTKG